MFDNSVVDKEFILHEKIEIDAILAQVGAERLWEYTMQKSISLFPPRSYNRAISMPSIETLYPTSLQNLITRANTYISNLVSSEKQEIMKGLENVMEENKKIEERLQKAEDEELKTIAKKVDELIRTAALSRI
jgi:gas vesicle protein